jgi:hypothetical protein
MTQQAKESMGTVVDVLQAGSRSSEQFVRKLELQNTIERLKGERQLAEHELRRQQAWADGGEGGVSLSPAFVEAEQLVASLDRRLTEARYDLAVTEVRMALLGGAGKTAVTPVAASGSFGPPAQTSARLSTVAEESAHHIQSLDGWHGPEPLFGSANPSSAQRLPTAASRDSGWEAVRAVVRETVESLRGPSSADSGTRSSSSLHERELGRLRKKIPPAPSQPDQPALW